MFFSTVVKIFGELEVGSIGLGRDENKVQFIITIKFNLGQADEPVNCGIYIEWPFWQDVVYYMRFNAQDIGGTSSAFLIFLCLCSF